MHGAIMKAGLAAAKTPEKALPLISFGVAKAYGTFLRKQKDVESLSPPPDHQRMLRLLMVLFYTCHALTAAVDATSSHDAMAQMHAWLNTSFGVQLGVVKTGADADAAIVVAQVQQSTRYSLATTDPAFVGIVDAWFQSDIPAITRPPTPRHANASAPPPPGP